VFIDWYIEFEEVRMVEERETQRVWSEDKKKEPEQSRHLEPEDEYSRQFAISFGIFLHFCSETS
jgi:hypothetical protein